MWLARFYQDYWLKMGSARWIRWMASTLIALHLGLGLAWFFEDQVQVPLLLQVLGRMHPVFLHLPIAWSLLVLIWPKIKPKLQSQAQEPMERMLWYLWATMSSITAWMGFLLSREPGYVPEDMQWHANLGLIIHWVLGLSVLAIEMSWLKGKRLNIWAWLLFVGILGVGHTGGDITHGEDFISGPLMEGDTSFDPQAAVFEGGIKPILNQYCLSCHQDQKRKGGLSMSSYASFLKGGKHGAALVPFQMEKSAFIQRIQLPLEDKKHMAPKGKPQVDALALRILMAWVKEGAPEKTSIAALPEKSPLKQALLQRYVQADAGQDPAQKGPLYELPQWDEQVLAKVNTPFCTVYPLAQNEQALVAEFYVSKRFESKALEGLTAVAQQLVVLNLGKMPLEAKDLNLLTNFQQLRKLNLNFTNLKPQGLASLQSLKALESLALSGNPLDLGSLRQALPAWPKLKELYLWNAGLGSADLLALKKQYPKLRIEYGPEVAEQILQINPPRFENESPILKGNQGLRLKHPMSGTQWHYALDEADVDTLGNQLIQGALDLDRYHRVKVRATKPGWYASTVVEAPFYRSMVLPDSIQFLIPPSSKWPGAGAKTLIDGSLGRRDLAGMQNLTWLGWETSPAAWWCYLKNSQDIKGMTLSYLSKSDAHYLPPKRILVWGSKDKKQWKLLAQAQPKQPKELQGYRTEAINLDFNAKGLPYLRVQVENITRVPAYTKDKKRPIVMKIDEVLFY